MRNTTTPHQETGIVGIDLGTTNSALSIYKDGKVTVISIDGHPLLPSCVGLDPQNEVVVGYPALNQYILFPERTVKSIKRRMGTTDTIVLGKESFLPEEISAIILGHLKKKAEEVLGMPLPSAVITVPAYFSDTQRKATHAAGEIAGFKVERIINEPTAAALAFRHSSLAADKPGGEISVVYDLGGGTFDVSIVREEQALTEVLASHGDTHLGGDDFDQLLCDHFLHHLHKNYTESLRDNRQVMNRLLHAAETCKIQLSDATYFRVMEEDLLPGSKKPIHLDLEVSRFEFEEMIHAHIDRTIDCIEQAMKDAKISPSQIDNILLVGGSTRIPMVRERIQRFFQKDPRTELNPDLCVTMGAALQGARIQGVDVERILVDITPFTFGISVMEYDGIGEPFPYRFAPIIHRNTPLPVSRSESFCTLDDYQKMVEFNIYQGENLDVRNNTKIGFFRVEDLSRVPAGNVIIGKMSLDLNGILTVTAVEKCTGLQKSIRIEDAYRYKSAAEMLLSKTRLDTLRGVEPAPNEADSNVVQLSHPALPPEVTSLIERAQAAMDIMHEDDRAEAQGLCDRITEAVTSNRPYEDELAELQELLYFVGA